MSTCSSKRAGTASDERDSYFVSTTVYVPTLSLPRKPRGVALHYPSPLPTSFDLPVPLSAASLRQSGIFDDGLADIHSDVLSTLFSRPFLPISAHS